MGNKTNIRATPLARKTAAMMGIELENIVPSGPNGRILVKDVEAAQKNQRNSGPMISITNPNAPTVTRNQAQFETKPMSGIRKATMKAMINSHTKNAAFTGMKEIDITPTVETKKSLMTEANKQGVKLTYLAFLVKAAAKSLQEMPGINVQIDEENKAIRYFKDINIGIAIDTPDGLMVPVIRNVDQMSIFEIASQISSLATKAREKKLSLPEMSGGTFTISNFGSVGLDFATPIINSPESAILGVGTMKQQPLYIQNVLTPRHVMPFSLTADHRVIDGADAGRFLLKMEGYLQNPITLFI